jgi:rare lipoprotein A (peptidoglycan hydrolase)
LALAFALAVVLALPIAARADDVPAAGGGAGFIQQIVTAPNGAFAGHTATINGHSDSGAGTVAVSAKTGNSDWLPVGTAQADASGDFTLNWKPGKSGKYTFSIVPAGVSASASSADEGTLSVYRTQKATWYGPGNYRQRTACGIRLTRRTLGVAHRTLPCGTRVEFFLNGSKITVPVIDRGPFVRGVTWDLTLAAMKRLGSSSTEILGALPLR